MSKPNLTLAAFCANLAYADITNRVQITLSIPEERDAEGFIDKRFITLKEGATGRNLAVYGHWYVTVIDLMENGFDLVIEENPPY